MGTMFGAFRPTNSLCSGLLWKIPWRLSKFQKARQRKRLRAVDTVVAVLDNALAKQGATMKAGRDGRTRCRLSRRWSRKTNIRFSTERRRSTGRASESCPNGRGFRNESILQDTDRQHWSECIIYQCTSRHGRRSENVVYHRGHLYEISTNQFSHI